MRRHGQGKMSKADGYKYDGNWLKDEEHGAGGEVCESRSFMMSYAILKSSLPLRTSFEGDSVLQVYYLESGNASSMTRQRACLQGMSGLQTGTGTQGTS